MSYIYETFRKKQQIDYFVKSIIQPETCTKLDQQNTIHIFKVAALY